MSGVLHLVGVGPGDPELVTLKAARRIAQCPVVAWPHAAGRPSRARAIAAQFISADAAEITIEIPMETEREAAQLAYDRAAARMADELEAERDVALLCEGDPMFYGSAMYLQSRLSGRFGCRVIPGVTSLSACAAAAGLALTARNEALQVVPGSTDPARIVEIVARGEAVAVIKLGRHLGAVRAALDGAGLRDRAVFVSEASLPGQQVLPLAEAPDPAPYFSMALIAGGTDRWAR